VEVPVVIVSEPAIRPLGEPGDLGWVVLAHGRCYAAELGWEVEAVTARIVADYAAGHDPRREAAWIAEADGVAVGCIFCVRVDDECAQLRLLLVDPAARGHGLGRRLVERCIDFARTAGYRRLRLWTNHPLTAARAIYLAAGFRLVEESPHRTFGVELVGQIYELDLASTARPGDTAARA
jgi:GNAT superfamily N-acetyltransferase